MLLALGACQIGEPELAAEFTADLLTRVDSPLAVVAHEWATAASARDAGRLDLASRTLEGLTLPLEAAEAAAAAADIHEDQGRTTEAIAGRARARRLLDRCPGADAPFLRRAGGPPTLTDRELEIAQLAAAGLSSAEIARNLYLSTRTVDTHLGRVYGKLAVRGRAELKGHPKLAQGRPRLSSTGRARRSGR
jgi:DNA-binding CsgD family transcriptional regulator